MVSIPKCLRLNVSFIYDDLRNEISDCVDKLSLRYYSEVESALRISEARSDISIERLTDSDKNIIVSRIIGGAYAIVDSWGTGSLMDTNNPSWNDYAESEYYNPSRPKSSGTQIVGRPAGEYMDIFGNAQISTGALEGRNLENIPGSPITPTHPSGAFQNADKWFRETIIKEEIDSCLTRFFDSVRSNAGRYFSFN